MRVMKISNIKSQAGLKTSKRILASAVASLRIEGLELDSRSTADFRALETGSLSTSDLRNRLLTRYSKTSVSR